MSVLRFSSASATTILTATIVFILHGATSLETVAATGGTTDPTGLSFEKEPPGRVDFSNNSEARVECRARGPGGPAAVTWISSDGSALSNISGLRLVAADGTLTFFPFSSAAFRQDVHGAIYRCAATNSAGTIVSHDVRVRAVMDIDYDSNVFDVFAIRGNTAVIKCHIPSLLQDLVSVVAYIRDDSLKIASTDDTESKFSLSPQGALYIRDVSATDAGTNYKCQTYHHLTGKMKISSSSGKLFVTDPHSNIPPRIVEATNMLQAQTGESVLLPCIAHGYPLPKATWYSKVWGTGSHSANVENSLPVGDARIKQSKYGLRITDVRLSDAGIYACHINNSVGQDRVEITLSVSAPLKVTLMSTNQRVDLGQPVTLTCEVTGHPVLSVTWTKNGQPVNSQRWTKVDEHTIRLGEIAADDKGMYQCFAQNERESAQAATELSLGEFPPILHATFREETAQPGSSAGFTCIASGNPQPSVKWTIDSTPVSTNYRIAIESKITGDGKTVSSINVRALLAEDGGVYTCTASNGRGKVQHSARLNIYGPLTARKTVSVTAVTGMSAHLTCPVYGYPIDNVIWMTDSHKLPANDRQGVLSNWTLFIADIQRNEDSGDYSCKASNKNGQTATGTIKLTVSVLPKIAPFSFQEELLREGMRARIQCVVSEGDSPVKITWMKDGQIIPRNSLEITMQDVDEFSSILAIKSVSPKHNGIFACVANNSAGSTTHAAKLFVNVTPKIVPFTFQGDHLFEGVLARVSCVVYQGDLPISIFWEKDGITIDTIKPQKGISIHTVDEFTSILTIDHVLKNHSGNYSCIAKNSADSAIHSAQLVVKVPPKIVPFSLQDEDKVEGMFVRVSCVVSRGDLPLTITWLKDGLPITPNSGIVTKATDEYSNVLLIDSVSLNHTGNFTCMVNNTAGQSSYTMQLKVNVPPRWINLFDVELFAVEDSMVMMHCQAEGYPKPTIIWQTREDSSIFSSLNPIESGSGINILSNGTLVIDKVQSKHEKYYICKASNGVGKGLSRVTQLKIQAPARIISPMETITTKMGQPVHLQCVASGHKPVNSSWLINGKTILANQQKIYAITRKDNVTLTITQLTISKSSKADAAIFTCDVINKHGNDSATIQVVVQGPPEFPKNVQVTNAGERSVELSWNTPFDGHSPITKYIIDYFTTKGLPFNQSTSVITTRVTLSDLQPSSTYKFVVYAENEIGRSEGGGVAEIELAGEAPSGIPNTIDVHPQNGRSLRISWQPPPRHTWNGSIKGYNVGFREADKNGPFDYRILEVPDGYNKGLSFTLSELREYTSYSIVVQAFNDHGKGPISDEIIAMTSEGVPSQAPLAVECSATSSQTVTVNWESPPQAAIHGILRGYRILYWTSNYTDGASPLIIFNSTNTKVTLRGLAKYANYSIQVLAHTYTGDGAASKPVFCKTLEDVPSPPRDVKALASSVDSILVTWSPPEHPNGVITHYTVYVEEVDSKREETSHALKGASTFHEVQKLRKNRKYRFRVSATTRVGEGLSTLAVVASPTGPTLPAQIATNGESIKQQMNRPLSLQCPAVGLPTPRRSWLFRGQPLVTDNRITVHPDGTLQISSLHVGDAGNYTCRVINDLGQDQVTHNVIVKATPSAPTLAVTTTALTTIDLYWKQPMDGNAPVLGYVLHFRQEFGPWLSLELQPYQTSFQLSNLHCGSTYNLYLVATNEVGVGQPSDTVTATTTGGVPAVPTVDQLVEPHSSHVVVLLDAWVPNGCPILYFVVEYRQRPSRHWTLVSSKLAPTDRPSMVLSDLQPGTWYSLRMTAHSGAGSTVAEYDFSTLNTVEDDAMNNDEGKSNGRGLFHTVNLQVVIPIISCVMVVMLCLAVTCFWVSRRRQGDRARNGKRGQKKGKGKVANKSKQKSKSGALRLKNSIEEDDDEISPYAMVKLSDIQRKEKAGPSGHSRHSHASTSGTEMHQFPSSGNYNPTAPPMSESYSPHGKPGMIYPHHIQQQQVARKYPVLQQSQGGPVYAMPKKERTKALREASQERNINQNRELPSIPNDEETTFLFPPPPPGHDGEYDAPPPALDWLAMIK